MSLTESEAIVLRTYKLSEADKIVVMLTPHAGLVRGVARGARRLKSRYGASFELFTHISITYHEREGRELVSIGQAEIIRSYFHLARDDKTVAALDFWSELLQGFVPPHQPEERLFRMTKACLEALGHAPETQAGCTLYFEVWLLKLAGFLPDVRTCAGCHRSLDTHARLCVNNQLLCAPCAQGRGLALSDGAHTLLRATSKTAPTRWAALANSAAPNVRQELQQFTRYLIAQALERAPRGRHTPAGEGRGAHD